MEKRNIILIEEGDLDELIRQVSQRIIEKQNVPDQKWIDQKQAMKQLGISSTSTLQKYRDEGLIRFTQPSRKIILYDRHSIEAFLEKNARNTF